MVSMRVQVSPSANGNIILMTILGIKHEK